jgi:hypothetical protein
VEPVHWQVAEALERRWNAALEQLETLETRLTALTTAAGGTRDAGCERRGRYLLGEDAVEESANESSLAVASWSSASSRSRFLNRRSGQILL